jgi:hypothetical protein
MYAAMEHARSMLATSEDFLAKWTIQVSTVIDFPAQKLLRNLQ